VICVPKGRCGPHHVLAECSQHSVGTRAEAHDVCESYTLSSGWVAKKGISGAPKMNPMIRPTAALRVRLRVWRLRLHATYIRPSCHPSSLRAVSQCLTGESRQRTLVKGRRAMRAFRHGRHGHGHAGCTVKVKSSQVKQVEWCSSSPPKLVDSGSCARPPSHVPGKKTLDASWKQICIRSYYKSTAPALWTDLCCFRMLADQRRRLFDCLT
jgi:hypothetical protein